VQPGVWEKLARDWSTPTGLSLVVTLGLLLGTIIGGLALAFAYVCIKRYRWVACGRGKCFKYKMSLRYTSI
jgi:hypothetical protein